MARIPKKIIAAVAGGTMALAVAMIAHFEGVRYQPYYDVVGVLTVCYGHTGNDIIKDKTYTEQECKALLEKDLGKVKQKVDPLIKVGIDDTTRAAIYSFTYNVGTGAFARSTLLKKINSGDTVGACDELNRWIYAGGAVWKGLVSRREVESAICKMTPQS